MQKFIQAFRLTVVALLLFCGVTAMRAQVAITANVTGTITDPTGAVIPNVKVTATNINTGVINDTTSDKDGVYNLRFLAIGTYKLTFEATGFGSIETPQFVLEVGQSATQNVQLKPGGSESKVTVVAELAPLLHTEDATQSTVLDARAIANIPMFGRSLTDLTQYEPGAIATSPQSPGSSVSVNGSRNQGNNYVLDGMETNQNIDYGQTYQPNPDAVEQVQNVTGTPTAEYGNVEGGNFITLLKSGTNQFHGNAFGNLRNYELDANTWAHKHVTTGPANFTPRSTYTTYQFGGTLGGPIIKNRLFGFGDYQGYRTHSTASGHATVPTYDERGCSGGLPGSSCTSGTVADFSELLNTTIMCNSSCSSPNSKIIQLFDSQNNFQPIPNNKNSVQITNPVAKYLFAHPNLLPTPGSAMGLNGTLLSATGNALDANNLGVGQIGNVPGVNNISTVTKSFTYTNQYDAKIDYTPGDKDRISGAYTHYYNYGTSTPAILINFPNPSPTTIFIGTLDEIHTFNSALVNDFRAGFERYLTAPFTVVDVSGDFGTHGNATLGVGPYPGGGTTGYVNGYSTQTQSAPSTMAAISGQSNTGSEAMGGISLAGNSQIENTFLYNDTLTWLRGKHNFKFGVTIGRYQQNNFYPGNDGVLGSIISTGMFYGDFVPDSQTTPPPNSPGALTGNNAGSTSQDCDTTTGYICSPKGYGYADFLNDRISGTAIGGASSPYHMRQYRDAYFVQDSWKLRPNFTLNLGLRYEYNTQISETNNRIAAPDIVTQTIIIGGTAAANTYCPGCANTLVHPFYGGVLPRVSFAYSVTPRAVIRAGYSAMQFMEGTGSNLRMVYNPPFQSSSESATTVPTSSGVTGTPYTEEAGFVHTGSAPSLTLLVWDKNIRPAYVNTFSLGVEYQLNNTSSISLGYVGKTGQHLVSPGYASQLHAPCTSPNFVTATDAAGVYTGAFNQVTSSSPTTSTCWNNDPAPYENVPGVGYAGQVKETIANAMENDNSLQASFRQRLWHGLQYTFNFTWGHALTNDTGYYNGNAYVQNFYNYHAEYGNSPEDIRLVSNWNMVYDLPFGRSRTFLSKMPLVLEEFVGGWRMAMTGVEQTGLFASGVSGEANVGYQGANGPYRPNQLRPLIRNGKSMSQWWGNDPSTKLCGSANSTTGQGPGGSAGVDNGSCAFQQPALGTFGSSRPYQLEYPGNQLYNGSLSKDFTIWHEHAINFRADALNVFNQSELGNPSTNVSSGAFGSITSVKSTNRQLQLTASYHF